MKRLFNGSSLAQAQITPFAVLHKIFSGDLEVLVVQFQAVICFSIRQGSRKAQKQYHPAAGKSSVLPFFTLQLFIDVKPHPC
jgi:hypothetical protein